jgi:hypothetical protein
VEQLPSIAATSVSQTATTNLDVTQITPANKDAGRKSFTVSTNRSPSEYTNSILSVNLATTLAFAVTGQICVARTCV